MKIIGLRFRWIPWTIALLGLFSITVIGLSSRPVNDDYWAMASLEKEGFVGSLLWYYQEFQGNVGSWLLILLHELNWQDGVHLQGALVTTVATFALLASAVNAGCRFLGVTFRGPYFIPLLALTFLVWLSLGSLLSPNALTFSLYAPSTFVHALPWLFGIVSLGLVNREGLRYALLVFTLGVFASILGFVELVGLIAATALFWIFRRRSTNSFPLSRGTARGWLLGVSVGALVQLVSPATTQRILLSSNEETGSTNVEAVKRALNALHRYLPPVADWISSLFSAEALARILVPFAVVTDLILRPGLILLALFMFYLRSAGLAGTSYSNLVTAQRSKYLVAVVSISAVIYAASGAMYAYAGRHVAGLSVVLAVLLLSAPTLSVRDKMTSAIKVAFVSVFLLLTVWQLQPAIQRSTDWDSAQLSNLRELEQGDTSHLISVPLKAGFSQSGLRDHDGSIEYQHWLIRWKPHITE